MARRTKTRARHPRKVTAPNWSKIRARFKIVMKDVQKEIRRSWSYGTRKMGRGVEAKILPSLRRARGRLETLITQLEKRAT